jgi:cell division protein FtsA
MGLPDAHSGPAFSTLVGLALLAGAGTGDIRDIATSPIGDRKRSKGVVGRLVEAMKGGF